LKKSFFKSHKILRIDTLEVHDSLICKKQMTFPALHSLRRQHAALWRDNAFMI
jgi:hypothetical protein